MRMRGMVNSYREEDRGRKSLPPLFTRGAVKEGSRILTSPVFYKGVEFGYFFFFFKPNPNVTKAPQKNQKGGSKRSEGPKAKCPLSGFSGGPWCSIPNSVCVS